MANPRRRYYRTIILGIAAMALLVYTAVDQFGISWREMATLFGSIVLGVTGLILLAGLFAGLWIGLRRLMRRSGGK